MSAPLSNSRKRNFSTFGLNKPKPKPAVDERKDAESESASPKKKKRRYSNRSSITGSQRAQIIRYAKSNPTATAKQIKNEFHSFLKSTGERTIQKIKKNANLVTEDELKILESSHKAKNRKGISKFPNVEAELLRRRKDRVNKNRDRSKYWCQQELQSIKEDKECLNRLNLNEYEKEHIEEFQGSLGFVNKVIKRNDLGLKTKHSDRKLTIDDYIEKRPEYLKQEREYLSQHGMIVDGKFVEKVILNADEVPGVLSLWRPKQVSEKDERVQLIAPPIVGHDKYRDCTWCPVIDDTRILFIVVILEGGVTISEREIPKLQALYPGLLIVCTSNSYMKNWVWKRTMKKLEIVTRELRQCGMLGSRPKQAISLYSDNCTMHSTPQAKRIYIRNWNIHERSLIPNATHCQQPVDQHIGKQIQQYVARQYWKKGEDLLNDIESGARKVTDKKLGAKEKRALICKWTNEAMIHINKKSDSFRHAWTNFGLYLPLNGESDGDRNTIVR